MSEETGKILYFLRSLTDIGTTERTLGLTSVIVDLSTLVPPRFLSILTWSLVSYCHPYLSGKLVNSNVFLVLHLVII